MPSLVRRTLFRLATNDRLERAVRRHRGLERRAYQAAQRYVAGERLADAVNVVRRLSNQGFAASLDLFGEGSGDEATLEATVQAYLEAARDIAALDTDVYLEVVPSHVGLDISVECFCEQVQRIAAALSGDARVHVSAEESWRTEAVIEAVLRLGADGAPVVATLQANLRRSTQDAERLIAANVPVRLVKGAYVEPADVAYPWGEETDVAYARLAHRLHAGGVELALGTHDAVLREALLPALPGAQVEMLLGVRAADAAALVERGHPVRIYVPYGPQWFRYWLRRVAESRGA